MSEEKMPSLTPLEIKAKKRSKRKKAVYKFRIGIATIVAAFFAILFLNSFAKFSISSKLPAPKSELPTPTQDTPILNHSSILSIETPPVGIIST